jgi:WD40 repeat protein
MATMNAPTIYETVVSYEDQWKKLTFQALERLEHVVLFDAVFWPTSSSSPDELLLAACANNGTIYIWNVPPKRTEEEDDDGEDLTLNDDVMAYRHPRYKCNVSNGVLYKLQIHHHDSTGDLLIVSGDEGIKVFDLKTFLERLDKGETVRRLPLVHFQPYPSATDRTVEVNDFTIQGNNVYGAVGDKFGCYKWCLETQTLVTTYQNPKQQGYLHTIQSLSTPTCRSNLIMTGGEDGIISLWDHKIDKLVDQINLNEVEAMRSAPVFVCGESSSDNKKWISSCAVLDDQWWSVAGGREKDGGFIATFSAPTRTLVALKEVRETPHAICFTSDRSLTTIANDKAISYWHPTSLQQTHRVSCSSRSAYSLAVASDGRIAVGGVGGTIDLYDGPGIDQSFQFTCTAASTRNKVYI